MTMVTEVENALKNATSSVLATLGRRSETIGSFLPIDSHQVKKQIERPFKGSQTRQVPVVPIILAAGAAALGTTATVLLVRRLAARKRADAVSEFTGEERSPDGQPDADLVASR
jgi:hypothetical protein